MDLAPPWEGAPLLCRVSRALRYAMTWDTNHSAASPSLTFDITLRGVPNARRIFNESNEPEIS